MAQSYCKEFLVELANKNPVICLKSENLHKRGGRGTAKDKMSIMGKNAKASAHKFLQNCRISHPGQNCCWDEREKRFRVIDRGRF